MRKSWEWSKPVWVLGVVGGLLGVACTTSRPAHRLSDQRSATAAFATLPMHFEANHGQTDAQVQFLARGKGYTLWLTDTADAVLALKKFEGRRSKVEERHSTLPTPHSELGAAVVRMQVVGANPHPQVSGAEGLPGKANYFLGNDPSHWRTNVPTYAKVKYDDVYPGIDLIYYGNQSHLEHDFIVQPGADYKTITLSFEGADDLDLDAQGNLALQLDAGVLSFQRPLVYQELDGNKRFIPGRYVRKGPRHVGFQLARYDRTKPLVIDPTLIYSTYLGGSTYDYARGVAVDHLGNTYVTGYTTSVDLPTQNPMQPNIGGPLFTTDAFVTKFNPSTGLIYSTYLGGSSYDQGNDIDVDNGGNTYLTGFTLSTNFPTQNPFQPSLAGPGDVFVTKLNSAGSALMYSTYLGGSTTASSSSEEGKGIVVDAGGYAYVTGQTNTIDFPVQNPFQGTSGGGERDAFVTKLTPSGSALVYSTYVGGSSAESATSIAVDAAGNAHAAGWTESTNFPTQAPFQSGLSGIRDAFVTKLNPTGSGLVYSTYLGGSNSDRGFGIAVDSSGNAYVTGFTLSTNFPTQNPFQPTLGGGDAAFVTKFNPAGSGLVYSTYLGGSGFDAGWGIAVNAFGNAYVTGDTSSTNFPTHNPFQATYGGGPQDAFVARFNPSGSMLVYSTFLGGASSDIMRAIAVDPAGFVSVAGETQSSNFPTLNAFQPMYGGGSFDAMVTVLDPLPFGAVRYGVSTSACLGAITMNVTERPKQGNANFALTVSNAPPNAVGLLIISGGQDLAGTPISGVTVHVNLSSPFLYMQAISADATGHALIPIAIPPASVGAHVFAQTGWGNTASCGGAGTLSASDALDITVQP